MDRKNSKAKILLAIFSLLITFLVWQQGLKDSLQRPSVSFDLTQKENEISELAIPVIPKNFKNILIPDDPMENIRESLSEVSYAQLTERNKLIWLILSTNYNEIPKNYFIQFNQSNYKLAAKELNNYFLNRESSVKYELLDNFKEDKYLYYLWSKKFGLNDQIYISPKISQIMFLKIIVIKLVPLISVFVGSILVLKGLWEFIFLKRFNWAEFKPLDLNLLDMVLLISGGFVVLGEVVSPLISLTMVELLTKNISSEISNSLKIFFGYLFMSLPPLLIIYYQIKSIKNKFSFNTDYFQFNYKPLKKVFIQGIRGWIMIIPFVLLISLIMNLFFDNQAGSNPLLEIVLNNNNYFAFLLLFITTTILAPFFEEIIFRGVLLPILSRDFGILYGVIISSFVFALAHLSVGELPPLFILGIGLAITRLISGSLLSSIIMHSLWNGLTFLNLFLLRT